MGMVGARDYAWVRESSWFRYAMDVGYTLTLVRGVAAAEVLRVMGAEPQGTCVGVDALVARQDELLDPLDYWDDSFVAGAFAVAGAGGEWTVVLGFDSGVGMRPRFMEALSAGGRVVAHSTNGGKPIHQFHWYEDGELRTTFEGPWWREGRTPDALNPLMREVGYALTEEEEGAAGALVDRKAAAFALAERLTGVRVTDELVRDAEYVLGLVPDEPAG